VSAEYVVESMPDGVAGQQGESHFGDRLATAVATRSSQLVLGLDPDPFRLWPDAIAATGAVGAPPAARTAMAVAIHCGMVLEAVAAECVAVKLQVACFERLGAPGWAALDQVARDAQARGLLVIADAKRGDIDVSAAAYAQAFLGETPTPFGEVPGLGADALTVNPLLGGDSLEPFVESARAHGCGLFTLVRTSNPGAADVQERELAAGGAVSDALAALVAGLAAQAVGESGLSDVGAVVGATAPERLEALREAMPHSSFLLPGVGAQGGRIEDLRPAFTPGAAGGLVTVSRGLVHAYERTRGLPATAAAEEAARLREAAWRLAS
jgi:orotidine-5'-phosphate decarboxylase